MSQFDEWLNEQLDGINEADIVSPVGEVEPGEEPVATLTDIKLRKMFTLSRLLTARGQELVRLDEGTRVDFSVELVYVERAQETVEELFWTGVHWEIPEEKRARVVGSGCLLDLRAGWIVVACRAHAP